jgi:putative ABC transport system permease protein
MQNYFFKLALHSLTRNPGLTALMFAAVAIGVAGSMSTYTIYYAMSGDPIPWKSSRLFIPQIDSWGPQARDKYGEPSDQLTYPDALALMRARAAPHQAAMYRTSLTFVPDSPDQVPFLVHARATYRDFFTMFDVPFRAGASWSESDENARANVVVLGARLAGKLLLNQNAVGRTVTLDGRSYRVVGVLDPWNPAPRFYEIGGNALADSEDVFLPFPTAIDRHMASGGHTSCRVEPEPGSGWDGLLASDCTWLQFWVELPTSADVQRYRLFLNDYASQQRTVGRFNWPPLTRLRDVRQWLAYKRVVSDELSATTLLGFGFLAVCLVNAVGLMLAKFASKDAELAVRRALGASRTHIFVQCLIETAAVGAVGGLFGLLLTLLCVAAERAILPEQLAKVAHVDLYLTVLTLVLATVAAVCAGLYPAWRVSRLHPARLLKAQ